MNKYIGRDVKMIKRTCIFDINEVVTILEVFPSNKFGDTVHFKACSRSSNKFGIIYLDEFMLDMPGDFVYEEENKIEDFKNKQSELQKELSLIDDKIKFMEESKTETFNENEFKIYQTLKTLRKEGLSDFEKAKIINDIINNIKN